MLGRVIAWSAFVVGLRSYWHKSIWFAPVIVAAIAVAVITFGHGEYLDFAEASQATRHIALSFVVKWGLIALVSLIALLAILRNKRHKARSTVLPTQDKTNQDEPKLPQGVDLDHPRSAAERILDEPPP